MKTQNIVFLLFGLLATAYGTRAQTGRVGIGTTTPRAGLDVNHDDGIVSTPVTGLGDVSNLPTGGGVRFMWIPKFGAFRAGSASGAGWDAPNIGTYSVAMGNGNTASGYASTVFGNENSGSGDFSTASGYGNKAEGWNSIALGYENKAEDRGSIAIGYESTASGQRSIAIGHNANAKASNSIAIGYELTSEGMASLATGHNTNASGAYSTAMGTRVTTSGKEGSFIIGDGSVVQRTGVSAPNKFTARFANGYLLYTSADLSDFVALGPGGNAWITSSDSTRKTNFVAADGEQFLHKLRGLRLGSWNYKKQDVRTMRHYGPMAQDFFSAYGYDGLGTVGNDTTLNAADVDGVAFVLLQALEKRTAELADEVELLKKQLAKVSIRDNRQIEASKRKTLVSK